MCQMIISQLAPRRIRLLQNQRQARFRPVAHRHGHGAGSAPRPATARPTRERTPGKARRFAASPSRQHRTPPNAHGGNRRLQEACKGRTAATTTPAPPTGCLPRFARDSTTNGPGSPIEQVRPTAKFSPRAAIPARASTRASPSPPARATIRAATAPTGWLPPESSARYVSDAPDDA